MKKISEIINKRIGRSSFLFVALFLSPFFVQAADLKGYILLDVESNGEAWYYNPVDGARYFLGRPADAFALLKSVSLGVKNSDLDKIPESMSDQTGDWSFRKKMSGRILLQAEDKGQAYYIYPKDLKKYYLGRPSDALSIMSKLGLGITIKDLSLIATAAGSGGQVEISNADGVTKEKKTVKTANGDFTVNLMTFDLSNQNMEVLSLAAADGDCRDNCPAKSLKDYIEASGAIAGINGAYFCPPDYADCAGKKNYYFYTFYDSEKKVLINESEIKWLIGSILVVDQNNKFYLFPEGKDFKSAEDFEAKNGAKIKSLMSNYPALMNYGKNIVGDFELDQKQKTTKGNRGGIGFKGKKMFFFIAQKATVPDLASIAESLGMEAALNLDGGGSSALYYYDDYLVGPGRLLPTAIAVRSKNSK